MTATVEKEKILTPEIYAFIEKWQDKPGNLIMVLHRVQGEFGFIPREAASRLIRAMLNSIFKKDPCEMGTVR